MGELEENDFRRCSAADAVALLLRGCAIRRTISWAWDAAAWAEVLGPSRKAFQALYLGWADSSARTYAIGLAHLFGFTELNLLGNVGRAAVARKAFGNARVDDAVGQAVSVLHGWGHPGTRRVDAPPARLRQRRAAAAADPSRSFGLTAEYLTGRTIPGRMAWLV